MTMFKTGVVQSITLTDNDINEVYSIQLLLTESSGVLRTAYPLDTSIKRIPLIGEIVLVFPSIGTNANRGGKDSRLYYMNPISIQLNPNNNALPPTISPLAPETNNQSYDNTSSGTPNVSNVDDTENDLGEGFVENDGVGSVQPFIGDVLIEGRFGHSLRFGYTPQTTQTSKQPSWSSSSESDPITILSNGRRADSQYNKFIIEDIDDDLSSIWLTSSQRVRISTSQSNIGTGVTTQSEFDSPTIILTSDRILLNSKSDYIILSSDKSVNIATPNWAMDMDKLFTEIQNLVDEVIKLNESVEKSHDELSSLAQAAATATYPTPAGPSGPALNIASFITSQTKSNVNKTESGVIKQKIQTILQNIQNMSQ